MIYVGLGIAVTKLAVVYIRNYNLKLYYVTDIVLGFAITLIYIQVYLADKI